MDSRNFEYYQASANAAVGDFLPGSRFPVDADQKARGQRVMDACGGDLERHHELQIAERVAHVDPCDGFAAMTWCGRRDLAEKQITAWQNREYLDVHALPVTKK